MAVIVQAEIGRTELDSLLSLIVEMGFENRPQWVQAVPVKTPFWARQVVELFFEDAAKKQGGKNGPDSLLIADDNFVDHATAALAAKWLDGKIPVIAGTNFPWITTSHVNAIRIGFDIDALMERAADIIDAWHQGVASSSCFERLPALFESEWRKEGDGR